MGTTTTTYGLTYPDTTGPNVTWAASYQANLALIEAAMTGQKLWNLTRSAWETKRAGIGYFPSVADNGSGKIRITCVGHGLINGDSIVIHDSSVAGYNGTGLSVTRITADTFDITATAYSATATGYWTCAANVYRASCQDGATDQSAVVRSVFVVNMPTANPSATLFTCTDMIRADYGGFGNGTYQRSHQDNSRSGVKDFVRTIATGAVNFYYSSGGTITPGHLYRIDYVA